ncbi:hypothetical protein NM208_g3156 [Fusarium decemcellulare]|uniref:Uncharacterized protein n=1 Tax=Fusarium decemcellulare TaxID=57161 RepID=A0ACC1SPZ2_9HYPO|nr:hypothetical protein NM208_g3156 [Fusarium decemcellulare]
MNHPASENKFTPKQALSPTPELYGEIVGDGMEQLAAASMSCIDPLSEGAVLHDVGCGLGAATAAAVENAGSNKVSIKGTDINDDCLNLYRQATTKNVWPAEALHMDAAAMDFPDDTFSHSVGNALLFVLPNDGIDAMKEMYRTLKPGGLAVVNTWAYLPTMPAIHGAALKTRPEGTQLPRQGLEKWEDADFLKEIVLKGGFSPDKVTLAKRDVYVTVGELRHFSEMLWSFIGGTSSVGWLQSDEENWERAVEIVMEELQKTDGYQRVDDLHSKIKFEANIIVAIK